MAELGETSDPTELIPGVPDSVTAFAAVLNTNGTGLVDTGESLRRVDFVDWTGDAADAFRDFLEDEPPRWIKAGDALEEAAKQLTQYVRTLTWAQQQAREAVVRWHDAQASGLDAPAKDKLLDDAQGILDRARQQLKVAADEAADAVSDLTEQAPSKSIWDDPLGDLFDPGPNQDDDTDEDTDTDQDTDTDEDDGGDDDGGGPLAEEPVYIIVDSDKYPESAQHILEAQDGEIWRGSSMFKGPPLTADVHIDRPGEEANRREALAGIPTRPGKDRDEYPPAMFAEGGFPVSVKHIDHRDNQGAGASIGNQARPWGDGTPARIVVI